MAEQNLTEAAIAKTCVTLENASAALSKVEAALAQIDQFDASRQTKRPKRREPGSTSSTAQVLPDAGNGTEKGAEKSVEEDEGGPGGYFRALSIHGLQELEEDVKTASVASDAKVHDLLHPVLLAKGAGRECPRDQRKGTAYVDAVALDNAGRARYMMSYAWDYKVHLIIQTLREWCDSKAYERTQTYVWICCLCINQHRVEEAKQRGKAVPFEEFEQEFKKRVCGIRHILSLMYPWQSPTYIKRSWCIFELFTAKKEEFTLELLMPKDEEHSFQEALLSSSGDNSMQDCWKLLMGVSLQDARSTIPDDKNNIDALVKRDSKFEYLDREVRQLLKEWFVTTAEKQLQVLKGVHNTRLDAAHACAQVGQFLENMGSSHFVRAIEVYRGGLGLLAETGQMDTANGIRLLTKIGAIKRRRGEVQGASATYQVASGITDRLGLQAYSEDLQDDDAPNAMATLCDEVALSSNDTAIREKKYKDALNAMATLCDEVALSSNNTAIREEKYKQAFRIRQKTGTLKTLDGAAHYYYHGRYLAERDLELAKKSFAAGLTVLQDIDNVNTSLGSSILSGLANVNRKLKKPDALDEALTQIDRSWVILDNIGSAETTVGAGVCSIRAEIEFIKDMPEKSLASYEKAHKIRQQCRACESEDGAKMFVGMARAILAISQKSVCDKEDLQKALSQVQEADRILEKIGKRNSKHDCARQCRAFLESYDDMKDGRPLKEIIINLAEKLCPDYIKLKRQSSMYSNVSRTSTSDSNIDRTLSYMSISP